LALAAPAAKKMGTFIPTRFAYDSANLVVRNRSAQAELVQKTTNQTRKICPTTIVLTVSSISANTKSIIFCGSACRLSRLQLAVPRGAEGPKSEIRDPKEIRSPKSAGRSLKRPIVDLTTKPPRRKGRMGANPGFCLCSFAPSLLIRDFGFRPSFGFRVSAFGFTPSPTPSRISTTPVSVPPRSAPPSATPSPAGSP